MASAASSLLVRPRRSLMSTAFVSVVLGMLPVFGVLYYFGIQRDSWRILLIVHVVLVLMCVGTLIRQLTVYSAVSASELSGRGIFSPVERVPLESIASVTIIPTYVGQAPDPIQQLLVRDAEGHRLFRMRGNFWHAGDLKAIADALPVPTTVVKEPISLREFFDNYPGSAYWFENSIAVRIIVVIGIIVAVVALTALILSVFG